LMVGGGMWFTYYAKDRVDREGAIFHVFERLGRQRDNRLDAELREIIKERGPREADPFDELFTRAQVIDIEGGAEFEELARSAGELLARELPVMAHDLWGGFMKGTRVGATPVAHGVALPHVRLQGIEEPHLVLVRVPDGVRFESGTDAHTQAAEDPVRAVFFLAGPEDDPGRHLRILAALARRVDRDAFMPEWLEAQGSAQLKEALFRNERLLVLTLEGQGPHQSLVGVELRSVDLPDGTLVAMVGRGGDMIIPRGDTVLQEGDRVTVLGGTDAIRELRKRFSVGAAATE
jgi:APA family basic amino acid/polyamine antiporter